MTETEKFIPYEELENMLKEVKLLIDDNNEKKLLQLLKDKIS